MAEVAENNEEQQDEYSRLTGTQKCAILMMLLGEEEASEILRNLGPKEVQHLGSAMYSVQGLDQVTVNRVLDEFLAIIKAQTSLGLGAGNYIKNVLTKALGDDKAQSVLSRITPVSSDRPIEILDWMDARSIAELISDEHPQIISLVISYLEFGLAADVLGLEWDGVFQIGSPADFILLDANSWVKALSEKPKRKVVVKGKLLNQTLEDKNSNFSNSQL